MATAAHSRPTLKSFRRIRSLLAPIAFATTLALLSAAALAQSPAASAPLPTQIQPKFIVIADSVVTTQWPHTLDLVSPPHNITLLNPGQCIRVGIIATGQNAAGLLKKTSVSFKVESAGHSDPHSLAPIQQFKQLKSDGNISTTLGVSPDRWCAPNDAADSTATISANIVTDPAGKPQPLTPATIQNQSFSTGSKMAVKSEQEFNDFFTTYYRQPNPARLLPILEYAVTSDEQSPSGSLLVEVAVFLTAALKADPVAANDFLSRITTQPETVRRIALVSLRAAGYDIAPALKMLPQASQDEFAKMPPLPDPYDLSPGPETAVHLDMLWGVFGATGDFAPVKALADTLAWRPDYDALIKWRDTPNHSEDVTPSLLRGVAYTAAGMTLHSFQKNDPLVADYIEFMIASPDTPPLVKTELKSLDTNPAFKKGGGQ